MHPANFKCGVLFRQRTALLSLCALAILSVGGASYRLLADEKPPEPKLSWNVLQFQASKLGISANTEVERSVKLSVAGNILWDRSFFSLSIKSRFLGRTSQQEFFFDRRGKLAESRSWRRSGTSSYWNERIYKDDILERHRRAPINKTEAKKPLSEWTEVRNWEESYPEGWKDCRGLSGPAVLFHFLASPAELSKDLCFLSKKALWKIELIEVGRETMSVEYTDLRFGQGREIRAPVEVRRIIVQPSLLHGDPKAGFQLLGLEGDLTLYLHPVDAIPLRLSGRMPKLGKITVFLNTVR